MQVLKLTSISARAAMEDEYSRKLLNLARKPLGSSEAGTLRLSLDVVRAEVEAMGKAHQNIAAQMKSELEEPLAAFAGGMKERRKIVQTGIEKLLKVKTQQTSAVNKARDRYEQDCLKIKGYLAQGHMVMGQEERKNKAKLEKTQVQLSATSQDYEGTVKVLEETTGRWNRDWKAACDKFQDLEEERIDFTKSSLWTFANIASTVCVSDDASCEKIRLSLEDCDVEKDIVSFIKDNSTGQEIPDPPKFIDFCRGDVNDAASETSEDGAYTVAQFPRPINPAIRSSSPQPSVFESHHDPNSALARDFAGRPSQQEATQNTSQLPSQRGHSGQQTRTHHPYQGGSFSDIPQVPHDPYPMDGMTQFCRTAPTMRPPSERSSATSPMRPSSRDSQSDYSNPTSFSSMEPTSGAQSPVKQMVPPTIAPSDEEPSPTKRKSFFNSPFSRRNKSEKDLPATSNAGNRNTWAPSRKGNRGTILPDNGGSASPEPIDPRANFQLNIGNNVFDVATPEVRKSQDASAQQQAEMDPIAQALEELKGVTKASSLRVSADRYAGLATPAPPGTPGSSTTKRTPTGSVATPLASNGGAQAAARRVTPPPSYDINPGSRLGAPPAAHTARAMQETTRKFTDQRQSMFSPTQSRGGQQNSYSRPPARSSGSHGGDMMRATSPIPRAVSPRPSLYDGRQGLPQQGGVPYRPSSQAGFRPPSQAGFQRAASPNPYGAGMPSGRPRANTNSPAKGGPPSAYGSGGYSSRGGSPNAQGIPRAVSPIPQYQAHSRPGSSRDALPDMSLQLAPSAGSNGRPASAYYGSSGQENAVSKRTRSKSVAEPKNYTADGRPILHYGKLCLSLSAEKRLLTDGLSESDVHVPGADSRGIGLYKG